MTTSLHPRGSRRATSAGTASLILGALMTSIPAAPAWSDGPTPPSNAATSWQSAERMTPEELAQILRSAGAEKPTIFYVGFGVLFKQARIPGSRYAGPGSSQTGLDALRKAVSALPKTEPIVLYCGCCPWERCPNIKPAWEMLRAVGFTRMKVLYIPKNFGQDWVQKGYPVEAGDPSRG